MVEIDLEVEDDHAHNFLKHVRLTRDAITVIRWDMLICDAVEQWSSGVPLILLIYIHR